MTDDLEASLNQARQLARMAALAELELLQEPGELPQILQRIVELTGQLLPASGGSSIILWDPKTEEFLISASSVPGQQTQTMVNRVRREGGATRWIVKNRQPHVVPDTAQDSLGANPILQEYGLKAYIGLPLLAGGDVLGVLYAHERAPRQYTEEDIQFLTVLAGRAAATVLNVKLIRELKHQATVDPLTGLNNKGHFLNLAEMEFERARRFQHPLSLMFLDLDHFKAINDSYGHLIGDQTLQWVARRIRENCRGVDVIGRYGGEEFVILLVEADKYAAMQVAERVRRAVTQKTVKIDQEELSLTLSIGVSSLSDEVPDFQTLLEQADHALYQAKSEGRNRVRFSG